MKSLNRAIARTVSQIARYAGEGCHVPMIMALENHLDALMTMERKMLEGVQDLELVVTSDSCFAPQDSQYWTPERVATFNRWDATGNAPPAHTAPDVINMADPRNWQAGDVVLRTGMDWSGFYRGCEYVVKKVNAENKEVYIASDRSAGVLYGFDQLRQDGMFHWLRHGDVQS